MRPSALLLAVLLTIGSVTPGSGADAPRTFDVWPDKVPGETRKIGPERVLPLKPGEKQVERITDVSKPTIKVFRPAPDKDTGASVVICPGGGYHILAWDLEGEEVAAWLNSIGVTGIVLKYRVPIREGQPRHQAPLQDVQRAISLVRSKAAEWGLHPMRVGVLGFSAGGNLAALAETGFDKREYEPIDDVDKTDCQPDFAILIYPAYLADKKGQLVPEVRVTSQTPPTFIAIAGDDSLGSEGCVALYQALKQAKVPAELHIYASGGHGFGLRPSEHTSSHWPEHCAEWLKSRRLLGASKGSK